MTDRIIGEFGQHFFCHTVTMQNHASYFKQKKFNEYLMLVYDGLMGKQYANPIFYP